MIASSSSISSRRTVIECVSSLAYSNLISCSPAPSSRSSLPTLSPPAMSRLCALIWIPLYNFGLSRPHSVNVQLCWSRPHLGNSLPHLSFPSSHLRQSITMFSIIYSLSPRESSNFFWFTSSCTGFSGRTGSDPAGNLLQCRASLGTTTVDFTLFTRSFTCCVRTGGPSPLPRVACENR